MSATARALEIVKHFVSGSKAVNELAHAVDQLCIDRLVSAAKRQCIACNLGEPLDDNPTWHFNGKLCDASEIHIAIRRIREEQHMADAVNKELNNSV